MNFQVFHVNPGKKLKKKMLITILAILCQSFLASMLLAEGCYTIVTCTILMCDQSVYLPISMIYLKKSEYDK